jgi:hypothetical protein
MIKYVLSNNPLTKDENDRMARVVEQITHTESDLAEALANRNIGVSKPEALALLQARKEVIIEWLKAGNAATLDLEHYHAAIPGVFHDGEHPKAAVIHITPSKEVAEIAKHIPLQRAEAVTQMYIDFVYDVETDTTNKQVTQGGNVKITGHNLKIAGTDPSVGIEFHSLEDPESVYRVTSKHIVTNNPSELLIVAPKMVTGELAVLKITTQYVSSGIFLNHPRSVTFDRELTVVAAV